MKKHGLFGSKIYASWSAMLYRCRNPKAKAYPNYGGRGILVDPRWGVFENFYADMGPSHWPGAELDRINPNGNYEPSNCRWVSAADNQRNRRYHVQVKYRGDEWNLPDLCLFLGVSRRHVYARLRIGWSLEDALTTKVKHSELMVIKVGGVETTIREAAKRFGLTDNTLRGRLKRGWTVERALGITTKDSNADR